MAPDDGPIEEKDCTQDLGFQVSTRLLFTAQVDHAVAAGSSPPSGNAAAGHDDPTALPRPAAA